MVLIRPWAVIVNQIILRNMKSNEYAQNLSIEDEQ